MNISYSAATVCYFLELNEMQTERHGEHRVWTWRSKLSMEHSLLCVDFPILDGVPPPHRLLRMFLDRLRDRARGFGSFNWHFAADHPEADAWVTAHPSVVDGLRFKVNGHRLGDVRWPGGLSVTSRTSKIQDPAVIVEPTARP